MILTAIVDGARDERPESVRAAAMAALHTSLGFAQKNFETEAERNVIMQTICSNMRPPPTPSAVRLAAHECAARVVKLYYDKARHPRLCARNRSRLLLTRARARARSRRPRDPSCPRTCRRSST